MLGCGVRVAFGGYVRGGEKLPFRAMRWCAMIAKPNPMYDRMDYYELARRMEKDNEKLKGEKNLEAIRQSLIESGVFTSSGEPKETIVTRW